jgi:hypothetical protein
MSDLEQFPAPGFVAERTDPRFVARAPLRHAGSNHLCRSSDVHVEVGHSLNLRKQDEK